MILIGCADSGVHIAHTPVHSALTPMALTDPGAHRFTGSGVHRRAVLSHQWLSQVLVGPAG